MPRSRFQFELQNDFTGGLHLGENPQHLQANEMPDVENLDPMHRGGLHIRGAISGYGGSLSNEANNLHMYERSSAAAQLILSDNVGVYYKTASTWTAVDATYPGYVSFAVFKDRLYMANGNSSHGTQRWDGSTLTALPDADGAGSWNNDIASPTASASTGNAPLGKHLAAWRSCLWIGNTLENTGADAHPNRVRWSHPNWPEDWYERHYIDVDEGMDGDIIVALVPAGDHLLVFKQRSVHAIYGNPPEGFTVVTLTQDIGAVHEGAVVSTDQGIFFFSWPNGVFHYTGKNFDWISERIYPIIEDGDLQEAYADEVRLGWGHRRLWLAAPLGDGATARDYCLVFDPRLSKEGTWTKYDVGLGPFVTWDPVGEEQMLIANSVGNDQLVTTDNHGTYVDTLDGSTETHIDCHVVTPFVDLGSSVTKKKWGRPQFQLYGGHTYDAYVTSYKDYEPTRPFRNFQLSSTGDGTGSVWDTGVWDTSVWSRDAGSPTVLEYGPPLGTAYSVALRIDGPKNEDAHFGFDAITWKWIPRKVRN